MPLDAVMPLDGPPEEAVPEDAMDAVPLEDVVPLEEAAPADRVPEEEGAGKEEQTAAEAWHAFSPQRWCKSLNTNEKHN